MDYAWYWICLYYVRLKLGFDIGFWIGLVWFNFENGFMVYVWYRICLDCFRLKKKLCALKKNAGTGEEEKNEFEA